MSGNRLDKPRRMATSKVIAMGVLLMDAVATLAVLALCGLAIVRRFEGALPYLTTLIGALQAVTGVVLGAYFNKSKAENTKGGIVYDAAMGVLLMDAVATLAVLALCGLAIVRQFQGALPYLTTLIGALQAVTGVVLGAYFNKSKAENTKGGIVYDAALGNVSDSDTDL